MVKWLKLKANVTNTVAVQKLLAPFYSGKKTLYGSFPCLMVLKSSYNFSYIFKKNQTKNFQSNRIALLKQMGVLLSHHYVYLYFRLCGTTLERHLVKRLTTKYQEQKYQLTKPLAFHIKESLYAGMVGD